MDAAGKPWVAIYVVYLRTMHPVMQHKESDHADTEIRQHNQNTFLPRIII